MTKFLIEVPHQSEQMACARAVKEFLSSGSHFVGNAEWGCRDGDHRAWLIVEVESREEARGIVPPVLRSAAKIIALNQFTLTEIDAMLGQHAK